ncbi:MAG: hypothetical protein MI745_14205 [Pseudomonadales bacterium]|nr:hypothetical protein [Pseudomonadales bacterium]
MNSDTVVETEDITDVPIHDKERCLFLLDKQDKQITKLQARLEHVEAALEIAEKELDQKRFELQSAYQYITHTNIKRKEKEKSNG